MKDKEKETEKGLPGAFSIWLQFALLCFVGLPLEF